jgi:hypothetical protein
MPPAPEPLAKLVRGSGSGGATLFFSLGWTPCPSWAEAEAPVAEALVCTGFASRGNIFGQARTDTLIIGKSAPSAMSCASCPSRQGTINASFWEMRIAIPEDRMSSSASGRVTM